jgi:hypothetical protein
MIKRVLILFLLSSFSYSVFSQKIAPSEYLLYTGKSYVNHPAIQVGTPTFKNYYFDAESQVTYHGHTFEGQLLMYDLILNDLIIFNPEQEVPVILPKGWVDQFIIKQDTFIHVQAQDYPGISNSGYYHKFFNLNGVSCLAFYSKVLKDEASSSGRTRVVNETVRYFIRTSPTESFKEVSKISQLLKLDPENRRKNRRNIYSMGMHTRARFGDAVLLVLSAIANREVE